MKLNNISPNTASDLSAKNNKPNYADRLTKMILPIMEEINFLRTQLTCFTFSRPIDATMAFARGNSIHVCPLFVIELSEFPDDIRPTDWSDPRFCDLEFLQKFSDWIAEECGIPKQNVSFIEAAAAKAIVKLKQDPQGIKALRAGIAHELAHVILGHTHDQQKSSSQKEKEADIFAAKHLPDGLEGIKIGFEAWQKSLQAVRSWTKFSWKDTILSRLLITPGGNILPLYFTHGFFETRIRQAEQAVLTPI